MYNYTCIIIYVLYIIYMKEPKFHNITGIIVSDPISIAKGLMFRVKKLGNKKGMLFNMKKIDNHGFWMKNTYISLDLIFLNSNFRVIGFVENNIPHDQKLITITKPSRYVLEMDAGQVKKNNITIGDYIIFNN